jgi:hypothetical protein
MQGSFLEIAAMFTSNTFFFGWRAGNKPTIRIEMQPGEILHWLKADSSRSSSPTNS